MISSIKNKEIRDRIVYTQPIPKVENLFKILDAFVHCARFEEFGLVVQEAMACGIPVITSKKVGAHEVFMNNPFLLEIPEKNNLAQKMVEIYENEKNRISTSEEGIILAQKNTWDKNIQMPINTMIACGLPLSPLR